MNASQFATAVNSSAMPAGNASLADFLLASSTNSGVATPDFKTVAASFFATPADTTPTGQPVSPASPATTKSIGATKLHERGADKNNDTKASELPSAFLPIIPAHLLNIVSSQYQVVSNPQASKFPKQSKTPTDTPTATTTVPVTSTLQFASQSMPVAPQLLSIGQNPSSLHDQPISAADFKSNTFREFLSPRGNHEYRQQIAQALDTTPQPNDVSVDQLPDTQKEPTPSLPDETISASPPQSLAIAEQVPETIRPNNTQGAQASIQVPETSAVQTESTVPLVTHFFPGPDVSKISAQPTNFTTGRPTPKAPTSAAHREIVERNSTPPTPRAEETPMPNTSPRLNSALEPAPLRKDLTLKQGQRPENSTSKQADSAVEIDPVSQSPVVAPRPVADLKSVLVETPVLESEIPGKVTSTGFETNPISIHPAQSTSSAQGTVQTEPQVVQADTSTTALKNDTITRPTIPALAAVIAPTVKSATIKSRLETASKSKGQGVNADTHEDGPNSISQPHQPEEHPVSALQNTADAGTNKKHDTGAPVANVAPHTTLDSAKNAPGVPASTTQHPDIDDTTPAAHTSINAAKLVQGLSQSELRVGLQTRDFGNIDIRTSVSRHEFSAQISVERGDVARTLTIELPNLYARLNEQQVSVSSIHIHDQSLSTSSGLDQRSQQSSQQQSQSSGFAKQQLEPTLPAVHEVLSPTNRLDIRI